MKSKRPPRAGRVAMVIFPMEGSSVFITLCGKKGRRRLICESLKDSSGLLIDIAKYLSQLKMREMNPIQASWRKYIQQISTLTIVVVALCVPVCLHKLSRCTKRLRRSGRRRRRKKGLVQPPLYGFCTQLLRCITTHVASYPFHFHPQAPECFYQLILIRNNCQGEEYCARIKRTRAICDCSNNSRVCVAPWKFSRTQFCIEIEMQWRKIDWK